MKTKKSDDKSRWVSGDQFQFHTPKTPQLKKGRRNTHHGGVFGKQQNSLQKHTNRTTYVNKSEKHMRSRVVLKRLEGSIQAPRKRAMSGGETENSPKKTKQDTNEDGKVKNKSISNEASCSFSLNGSQQEGNNASPKRSKAGKSPSPKGSAKAKKAGSSQKKAAAKKRASTPKSPRTQSPKEVQKEKSQKSSHLVSRPRRSVVQGLQVSESKEMQSSTSKTTPKRRAASKNKMFEDSLTHEITGWEEVSKYGEEMEIDGNLVSKEEDFVKNGTDQTDASLKSTPEKEKESLEVGTEARETSSSWSCNVM